MISAEVKDYFIDFDARTQQSPFGGRPTSYYVRVENDCTGDYVEGELWVEAGYRDDSLRDDLIDRMDYDCEFIVETARMI